jgi:hypothetical protein
MDLEEMDTGSFGAHLVAMHLTPSGRNVEFSGKPYTAGLPEAIGPKKAVERSPAGHGG